MLAAVSDAGTAGEVAPLPPILPPRLTEAERDRRDDGRFGKLRLAPAQNVGKIAVGGPWNNSQEGRETGQRDRPGRRPKWMNLLRAVSSEGLGRLQYHRGIHRRLDTDPQFPAQDCGGK